MRDEQLLKNKRLMIISNILLPLFITGIAEMSKISASDYSLIFLVLLTVTCITLVILSYIIIFLDIEWILGKLNKWIIPKKYYDKNSSKI